ISRPPRRAPRGLASLGRTISAISDWESQTGRGVRLASDMIFPFGQLAGGHESTLLLQIRFEKAFRHFLNAGIGMQLQPRIRCDIKHQFAVLDRTVIPFADVREPESAGRFVRRNCRLDAGILGKRSDYRESHGIPQALGRRPGATAGVSQVAEGFKNVLRRSLLFMSGSRAMSFP